MYRVNCGCTLVALRTLMRVEELTSSLQVPLETALQAMVTAERPSLGVLSCERCRHQRLPLTAVTILCAELVDWLCRLWNLDDKDAAQMSTNGSTTTATVSSTLNTDNTDSTIESHNVEQHPAQPWRFSLGSYELAADEADALSNELMALRLTDFSAVLGSLEAALVTSATSLSTSSPQGSTNGSLAPACLDLVRENLRLVRACIRRLKARSLLNV